MTRNKLRQIYFPSNFHRYMVKYIYIFLMVHVLQFYYRYLPIVEQNENSRKSKLGNRNPIILFGYKDLASSLALIIKLQIKLICITIIIICT